MPELPDLLYIKKYLNREIERKTITDVIVKQPIILRVVINQPFERAIVNQTIMSVDIHGPFIRLELSNSVDLIINLMLAGRFQHQRPGDKPLGYLCCSLVFEDGSHLNLCDEDKMAKLYVVPHGDYASVPRYAEQGVDILSPGFTRDVFKQLAHQHSRKQVRVFINDHTALSSIGNAYADEILFDAQIHPKTFTRNLGDSDLDRLHSSILSVMERGIREVEEAAQPIHVKVRDHMKVRNRRGEPCPRCGNTIRREGVLGHDVFFCPICQPASRKPFIDWTNSNPRKP